MGLFLLVGALGAWTAWDSAHAAERLTPLELRWLAGAAPIITYARKQNLPLDVVVQPTDQPGLAPLAMGYVDGRCKLVLSMRGNPSAEQALDGVAAELVAPVIEAVVAHEIGHCWRYVQGAWHTVPAGFKDTTPAPARAPATPDTSPSSANAPASGELTEAARGMRDTRREEGFADLVGLAWAQNRYPELYPRVHAWFSQVRDDPHGGGHHDTRAWIRLVRDPAAFADADTPFAQVLGLWREGLRTED